MEPEPDNYGGNVIVLEGDKSLVKENFDKYILDLKNHGNANIDMLFCVPPSWVVETKGKNEKGKIVGKILYESKDEPSSFQSKWEPKLQNDMKASNADLGVIFSASVPRDFSKKLEFQKKGNIYICKNDYYALKFIVMVLRMNLIMKDSLKAKGKENLLTALDLLEDSRTRNFLSLLDMGHKKAIKDASKLVTAAEKHLTNLKGSDEQYESF